MHFFWQTPPIYKHINEYCAWKALRSPLSAGTHRSLLMRFVENHHIWSVEEITEEKIAWFIGEELSKFYIDRALFAIRAFLRYTRLIGYSSVFYTNITMEKLSRPVGRPRATKFRAAVKEIKREHPELSIRGIKAEMEKRFGRHFAISSVHKWAH